jgi:Glutaredoxin-like domain (DUF836)
LSAIPKFILYTTLGCHLCGEAQSVIEDLHRQMLQQFGDGASQEGVRLFEIELFDIADDDVLIEQYGVRIPVLLFSNKQSELSWPFDVQGLYQFMVDCV